MNWYDDYANVTKLGRWLVDYKDFAATDLQRYYEAVYKWTDEWKEMNATTPYPDVIGDVEIEVARCKRCGRNTREHNIDVQGGLCGDCGQDMIDRDSEDRAEEYHRLHPADAVLNQNEVPF